MGNTGMEHQPDSRSPDRPSNQASEPEQSSGGVADWMQSLREVAPYLDLGWRLAGTAAFPPLIGYGLDLWVGTTPWLLLGGCVLGFVGALGQLKHLKDEFGH